MSSIPVFDISNPLGGLLDQAVAMGYVNEKRTTTKGAIAAFEDNIEHAVSVEVDIAPTLDGVSVVNVTFAGKNVLPLSLDIIKSANSGGWSEDNEKTINGVTFKIVADSNGHVLDIIATGSATANAQLWLKSSGYTVYPAGTLSGCDDGSSTTYRFEMQAAGSGNIPSYDGDTTFTPTQKYRPRLLVSNGYEITGELHFKPMLRISGTDTYEPFIGYTAPISLGSTVHGGSVSVSEEGEVELTTTYAAYSFTGSEEWTLDTDETYFETELSLGTAIFADDSAYMTSNGILLRLQDDGKTIRAYLADNESLTAESDMNEVFTNTDKLVYELATLSSTDLTDIDPIETIVGENNIWADTGDIEVGYYYQLYQPI